MTFPQAKHNPTMMTSTWAVNEMVASIIHAFIKSVIKRRCTISSLDCLNSNDLLKEQVRNLLRNIGTGAGNLQWGCAIPSRSQRLFAPDDPSTRV